MWCNSVVPWWSLLVAMVLTIGAPNAVAQEASGDASPPLRDKLKRIAERRIFFGHQSVGANILDGVRDLARAEGVELKIAEADRGSPIDGPSFTEAFVGRNTDPASKIEAFSRAMDEGWAKRSEIAFFKFCYVDFDAATDVDAIFERYVRAQQGLKARHRGLVLVHVTVPLTVTQDGAKGFVKKLFGRAAAGEFENVRRERFNELLREKYLGREPFFDLARIEATFEDGRSDGFEWEGRTFPRLVRSYSDDGGHLNARGRKHVARAFVDLLASMP